MALHVRRDDMVEVIAGDYRGQKGKVLRVDPTKKMVWIQGINMVFRHVRPSRKNPQGGRLQKEAPLHLSKVLPVDEKKGRGARVRFEATRSEDGRVVSKHRVTVDGTKLNELTRGKN